MTRQSTTVASLIYRGRVLRVPVAPFESQESAYQRGWFVAQQNPKGDAKEMKELWCKSHKYINEAYCKMTYQ